MAGIEAAEEMTSDQLDAMAGGDLLKNEVISLKILINQYMSAYIIINFRLVTSVKYEIQKNRHND